MNPIQNPKPLKNEAIKLSLGDLNVPKELIGSGNLGVAKSTRAHFIGLTTLMYLSYPFTKQSDTTTAADYHLPETITVNDTSLKKVASARNSDVESQKQSNTQAKIVVFTKDIDFSKEFFIKTDRYTLVKNSDWWATVPS